MSVIELALDGLLIHIIRYGVVDIKERYGLSADTGADKLGQGAVYVDLAGYRDASSRQAAVDIAGNKLELCLESRPALSGDADILSVSLMRLDPVKQGQLVLRKSLKDLRLLVAGAEFLLHICDNLRNPLVAGMIVEGLEQIKFRILLDLNSEVVELLYRSVAREEVVGSRAEGDEFQF